MSEAAIDIPTKLYCGSLPADSTDDDWLRQAADLGSDRVADYETFERWYDGYHRTKLIDRAKEFLEGDGIDFAENFCAVTVDSIANRLRVEAFEVAGNTAATKWLNDRLWTRNRFNVLQGIVHVETPKLGDGFLIADWDSRRGRPRFAWNRPHIVKPVYSEDGEELLYAVKRWPTTQLSKVSNPNGSAIWRMNVYFDDRIEKWFSGDKDAEVWERWQGDDDADDNGDPEWPTRWVDDQDEPLGVGVFHFRSNPQGRHLGRSDVRRAIPFQRQINKQAIDLFYVMDEQGWGQRWATGVGETQSLKVAIGEFLKATDANAKFGKFEAEDPRPLLEAIEKTLTRLAVATGTPVHEIISSGQQPSGEARKTAEASRDARCGNFADVNGPVWADASRMGWRLAAAFTPEGIEAPPEFDPDADLTVTWEPPGTRSEKEAVEIAEADQRMGVSRRTTLLRRGYDPDEEEKQRAEEKSADAELAARAFEAGRFDDGQGGGFGRS